MEQEFDFFMARHEAKVAVLSPMDHHGHLTPVLGLASMVVGIIRILHQL